MPMYQAAHVYFSSTLAPELLAEVRSTPGLAAHLATLQEANLEFSVFDCRTFHTSQVWRGCGPACQPDVQRKTGPCKEVVVLALPAVQERALQHLFGRETAGHTDQYKLEVHTAARRVVSLLLSLKVAMRDMADRLCTPLTSNIFTHVILPIRQANDQMQDPIRTGVPGHPLSGCQAHQ